MIKEILKITAILSLIALIAGGLLGLVYAFCKVDDSEILAKKMSVAYESEISSDLSANFERVGDSFENGTVKGVYRPLDGSNVQIYYTAGYGAYKGTIELLVVIKDDVIDKILTFSSSETPGLGSKATEDTFYSNFVGVNAATTDTFAVVKEGGTVQEIASATYSSRAVTRAINCVIEFYQLYGKAVSEMELVVEGEAE